MHMLGVQVYNKTDLAYISKTLVHEVPIYRHIWTHTYTDPIFYMCKKQKEQSHKSTIIQITDMTDKPHQDLGFGFFFHTNTEILKRVSTAQNVVSSQTSNGQRPRNLPTYFEAL
jgi:hypothetical protein